MVVGAQPPFASTPTASRRVLRGWPCHAPCRAGADQVCIKSLTHSTLVIVLHAHRALVALPTPRGATPAVWGQSHATGPQGRVQRVGSQRRRTAVADALRMVGVWSTYLALRPLIDCLLVWIVPFCRTFQSAWLVWMLLNPVMASRVTFSLVRPWIRRNEPWIDEACLWALGVYLVGHHVMSLAAQRCTRWWTTRRAAENVMEEAEVEQSLPANRDVPALPGAIITPRAPKTPRTPTSTRLMKASPRRSASKTPGVPTSSTRASQQALDSQAPHKRETVSLTPSLRDVPVPAPRSAPRQEASSTQPDTPRMPISASTNAETPSTKRKRASHEESIALSHIEARRQAESEPAIKLRRRAPTSAGKAPTRRIPSQTSLLPRPKRERSETLRSSERRSARIQTRAQRARTATHST